MEENIKFLKDSVEAGSLGKVSESLKEEKCLDKDFQEKVRAFVTENFESEKFEMEKFCRHMCMSRTALYCRMKAEFGMSPREYVIKCRMERAKFLLEDKSQSITDIAYRLGFCDQRHFRKTFKRYVRMSPTEYRRMVLRES